MTTPAPQSLPAFSGRVVLPRSLGRYPRLSHVVFDFDGTLSWLRHGWPEIMLRVMQDELPVRAGETDEDIRRLLNGIIHGLNGRPTILQMIRFAEIVRERGGSSLDPEMMRARYQDRLDQEIAARTASVRNGMVPRDAFVVHQARALLDKLIADGMTLSVLSSTVVERVREEAEILGLTSYFGGRIFGCVGNPERFSKRAVFEQLLRDHGITGDRLLSFGDGPVEILDTKQLGGAAIAVCSDEDHNGSGQLNQIKHDQLLAAGADAAVPDFRDAGTLVDCLRGRA
jgi:FMN phosphatase YigB (HAD superfamily)